MSEGQAPVPVANDQIHPEPAFCTFCTESIVRKDTVPPTRSVETEWKERLVTMRKQNCPSCDLILSALAYNVLPVAVNETTDHGFVIKRVEAFSEQYTLYEVSDPISGRLWGTLVRSPTRYMPACNQVNVM
jgi:hypothetical protein